MAEFEPFRGSYHFRGKGTIGSSMSQDGYAEFLKSIANPKHKAHRHCLHWCGGAFDPAGFDLQSVNRDLQWLGI